MGEEEGHVLAWANLDARRAADAIADGFAVARLIHTARPDLLVEVHAFESGLAEAARNWNLLRQRVLRKLGSRVGAACAPTKIDILLRGRSAEARHEVAVEFLCALRPALRAASPALPRRTRVKPEPALRREVDAAWMEERYEEIRAWASRSRRQELDALEVRSKAFDEGVARLRAENLEALEATEREIERLRAAGEAEEEEEEGSPPPPPDTAPPAHCVPVATPTVVQYYRRLDPATRRHYYEDARTRATAWEPPEAGIVHAVDDLGANPTYHAFYLDAKSKRTAWTLSEM